MGKIFKQLTMEGKTYENILSKKIGIYYNPGIIVKIFLSIRMNQEHSLIPIKRKNKK